MRSHCRFSTSTSIYRRNYLQHRQVPNLQLSTYAPKYAQSPRLKGHKTLFLVAAGALAISIPSAYFSILHLDHDKDPHPTPVRIHNPDPVSLINIEWPKLGISQIAIGTSESNKPGEDGISTLYSDRPKFGYFGIYDGHLGGDLSKALCEFLLPKVSRAIDELYQVNEIQRDKVGANSRPSPEAINDAIKQTFIDVDDEIVHQAARKVLGLDEEFYRKLNGQNDLLPETSSTQISPQARMSKLDGVKALKLANAGSCVLVGVFDAEERSLRVALTGDSRAVFGRRMRDPRVEQSGGDSMPHYVYKVEALTADQNASNPAEAARLSAKHPGEEDLLKNGRTLGWGCSRAFGDGLMKWSREVRERLYREYLGDKPRENYKTPPYFTAEPVITTKTGIQKGDFAVFATDGLWECLENEEVVGLVGQWLEANGTKEVIQKPGSRGTIEVLVPPAPITSSISHFSDSSDEKAYMPSELPVIYPSNFVSNSRYQDWGAEKKFACQRKDTVALHLIRNALGGADKDLHDALLEFQSPRSRKFRDDISVVVVFFD